MSVKQSLEELYAACCEGSPFKWADAETACSLRSNVKKQAVLSLAKRWPYSGWITICSLLQLHSNKPRIVHGNRRGKKSNRNAFVSPGCEYLHGDEGRECSALTEMWVWDNTSCVCSSRGSLTRTERRRRRSRRRRRVGLQCRDYTFVIVATLRFSSTMVFC